jgi:PIN domain nuclease of toxin-antitoxin system
VRLLLDTNVLIYSLTGGPKLAPFRQALEDTVNEVYFSVVSLVEISIKASLGKLKVPATYGDALAEQGFTELPLVSAHANALRLLPWHHRDPFDRLIIAQAMVEDLTVVTTDPQFANYGVRVFA